MFNLIRFLSDGQIQVETGHLVINQALCHILFYRRLLIALGSQLPYSHIVEALKGHTKIHLSLFAPPYFGLAIDSEKSSRAGLCKTYCNSEYTR